MSELPISIKIQNYKCYGKVPQGFEVIKRINVIVGRNNSGKSALIDLIQQACLDSPVFRKEDCQTGGQTEIIYKAAIPDNLPPNIFRQGTSGGGIQGSHEELGRRYIGVQMEWAQPNGADKSVCIVKSLSQDLSSYYAADGFRQHQEQQLASLMRSPLRGREFRRIAAERNVSRELDNPNEMEPKQNGDFVTNLIQRIYIQAENNRALVDERLLRELNEIVSPEYQFTDITVRQQNVFWEVYLREDGKDLIPLSASGSGIKTILQVLCVMMLSPTHRGHGSIENFVFGFEELENSLHPALLRRLLAFVTRKVKEEKCYLFLTTHSNVTIDLFASDPDAQLIHTVHSSGQPGTATIVSGFVQHQAILSDLDVRASDLLQANGIIWVEGPSDRIYINRWIALFSAGQLREGTHYQCVFYGGKLLAHLSCEAPEVDAEELLSILRVNRHAAILIDSDRDEEEATINATKKRIIDEIESVNGFAWLTAGREIENYLPAAAIYGAAGIEASKEIPKFSDLEVFLEKIVPGSGKRFGRNKASYAAKATESITLENQQGVLDWQERMADLCSHVRKWNRMPEG